MFMVWVRVTQQNKKYEICYKVKYNYQTYLNPSRKQESGASRG